MPQLRHRRNRIVYGRSQPCRSGRFGAMLAMAHSEPSRKVAADREDRPRRRFTGLPDTRKPSRPMSLSHRRPPIFEIDDGAGPNLAIFKKRAQSCLECGRRQFQSNMLAAHRRPMSGCTSTGIPGRNQPDRPSGHVRSVRRGQALNRRWPPTSIHRTESRSVS